MTKDDMEIVSTVRTALADKVGQERFDLWFGASTRLTYDGRVLRVGAPSEFFLEWIRANFRRHIEMACSDVLGNCPAIEFHLDVATTQGDDDSMQAALTHGTANSARPSPQPAALEPRTLPAPLPASPAPEGAVLLASPRSSAATAIAWPSPRPRWSSASRANIHH